MLALIAMPQGSLADIVGAIKVTLYICCTCLVFNHAFAPKRKTLGFCIYDVAPFAFFQVSK